mgnify:CR=1 FL=1
MNISKNSRAEMAGIFFILPNLITFTVFVIFPAISGFYLAFTDYSMLRTQSNFIGLENFKTIFSDFSSSSFLRSMLRTFVFTAIFVPVSFFFSLFLSVITTSETVKGKNFLRTLFYWPWILSPVIVALSWKWFLDIDAGFLNIMLEKIGMQPKRWLLEPNLAFFWVTVVNIWYVAGYFMVMFNAALTSIPQEVYDAASIDGANKWQRFWSITFPLLRPTSILVLVLSMIMAIRSFELVYVFTKGGPGNTTMFMVQKVYEVGFQDYKLGLAAAMSVVMFFVLLGLTLIQFRYMRQEE